GRLREGTMTVLERSNEIVGMMLKVLTVVVLLMSILAYFASSSMFLEMLVNYRFQYFIASIAMLLYFVIARSWIWLLVISVSVFMNGLEVIPCYAMGRTVERGTESETVSFFVANVRQENTEYDKLFARIDLEDPDVVLLQEIDRDWMGQLGKLGESYPYSFLLPKSDRTGIGMLSKSPFSGVSAIELGPKKTPCVVAHLQILGQTLTIFGTHLTPPIKAGRMEQRNEELEDLADHVRKTEGRAVVIGNLNASTWAPPMKTFLSDTSMMDARKGYGILTTWPVWFGLIRVPIDYCLVGEGVGVKAIRVIEACGSDHYTLYVETFMTGDAVTGRD
ncbi:endonuclease/exonuclease/phosphatase family protein, partial [Planctomycetota bacterium]